jgi:hypothetical protein
MSDMHLVRVSSAFGMSASRILLEWAGSVVGLSVYERGNKLKTSFHVKTLGNSIAGMNEPYCSVV